MNPLSSRNAGPAPPPDWAALFPDPTRPLILDLGCGPGRFLLALASRPGGGGDGAAGDDSAAAACSRGGDNNHLGVEIRAPLAARADAWAGALGLAHARFVSTNATVNAPAWLATYPGPLALVSVLHPDPHWKRRHRKRRLVQPALALALALRLRPGTGLLWLQSDVKAVTQDMVATFEQAAGHLLELDPSHWGEGADPAWPPPGAERVNQGDDAQRDAARAASAARRRAAAKRGRGEGGGGGGGAAAGAAAAAASAGEGAADAPDAAAEPAGTGGGGGGGGGDGDEGGDDDDDDDDGSERFTGWAALPGRGWLRHSPVGVPTEREVGSLAAGGHVWRALLRRRAEPAPAPGAGAGGGGGGVGGGGGAAAPPPAAAADAAAAAAPQPAGGAA